MLHSQYFLLATFALVLFLSGEPLSKTFAFAPPTAVAASMTKNRVSPLHQSNGSSDNNNDPTKSLLASFADKLQNVLTNSPLNEGKKALVKSLAGDYDVEATRAKLNGLIDTSPVLMLSFTTCPFCIKAKSVLDSKGVKYTTVELDVVPDGKAIRAEMADSLGRTSVPAIWIGKAFVGGCNDGPLGGVVKLNDAGKLDAMLKEVGAM